MGKQNKRLAVLRSATRSAARRSDSTPVEESRRRIQRAAKYVIEALEQRLMLTAAAPTNLITSPDSSPGGSASLLLAWQDNSSSETGFKIKRSTDGTNFTQIDTVSANLTSYNDTTVTVGTHYWYEVFAYDGDGDSEASNASDAVEWASSNIGTVTGGSAATASGVTTIVTAGQGIGWIADDFRYDYRTLSGDGYIIAKVTGVQYTNPMARAGVMFRNSLAANSREVMMALTAGSGADFVSRDSDGNTAADNLYSGYTAPYWVKLAREGSQFSGYVSSNGTTWSLIRQINISMGTNVYVGLGVSSSGYGASNTSTFSDVSVTRTDHGLPSGWSDQDLGSASFAGSARFYNNTFTFAVESSGQNIGGTSDTFHFAHRTLIGDGEMIARVANVQTGYSLAKAGIMFRDGMGADAKNVFLGISAGSGAVWQSRTIVGGNAGETWSTGLGAPYYVRIVRSGDMFTGYLSADGNSWTQIGSSVTISDMSSSLEVGIALSAAGYGALNTSSFDNVKMISAVPTLTATLVHAGRIDLSWTDNSGSETGFILQRSEDDGATWTTLGEGGEIHASGYADDTVDSSKTYKYRVKSFIDDVVRGESDWSLDFCTF